ncbi:MAG: hypothetical protein H7A35_11525 [Planctomycetales bacterium]|nr:hypothetical protein [bacterium]UNM07490.1 MAG: hypothetical protein H7A35_11525 [Planctomycetales bacterium]
MMNSRSWSRDMRLSRLAALLAMLALLLAGSSCNLLDRSGDKRAQQRLSDISRQHVHLVRHQLEKWAEAHNGMYPDRIEQLIEDGNFETFPDNPATRSPMSDVDYEANDRSGNFTYYPVYGKDAVIGFYLLGYGYGEDAGEDVTGDDVGDKVQLVLASKKGRLPAVSEVVSGKYTTPPLLFTRLDSLNAEIGSWGSEHGDGSGKIFPGSLDPKNSPVMLPQNPFTDVQMKPSGIQAADRFGNFAYVPFRLNGTVRGYYLLGFGTGETPGYDVDKDGTPDNVVKILRNGPDSMPELHVLIGQNSGS